MFGTKNATRGAFSLFAWTQSTISFWAFSEIRLVKDADMKKNQPLRLLAVAVMLTSMYGPVCVRADTVYATLPNDSTVDKFTSSGVASAFATDPGDGSVLNFPVGMAFDSVGNLYVANNSGGGNVERLDRREIRRPAASHPVFTPRTPAMVRF